MNLQQLEYFVLLAKREHMTNTAKELNTSQPNLSYAMNELEKELGVPLFKKAGRNIQLTRYGSVFFENIQPVLTALDQAEQMIQDMINPNTGIIHFGFIYTMGSNITPRLIQDFRAVDENKDVQFQVKQGSSSKLVDRLAKDDLDIILTSYMEDTDGIHFEPFYEEPLVLIVPENHPLADLDATYLKEITPYPLVYFEKGSGLRRFLDKMLQDLEVDFTIGIEVEEDHTVLGFVAHQHGIAILPDIPSINSFPVKKIKILDQLPARWIYLAYRKNSYLSPTTRRFLQYCLENKPS